MKVGEVWRMLACREGNLRVLREASYVIGEVFGNAGGNSPFRSIPRLSYPKNSHNEEKCCSRRCKA